jgi:hypothetical protein
MNQSLFKMALERMEPSDWNHFERLCSAFLVSDFPNLRTVASASGDGGRDSELYSHDSMPIVVIQYSIASDWKAKIKTTVKRLSTTFPHVKMLIYMSNQLIGSQADELKKEIMIKGIMIDVRDRNWFIERAAIDAIKEGASEELINQIARPYLEGENIIKKQSSPLTSGEARAALIYLGLQWQDDITNKGLTKLSFDALVRAALRHTSSENKIQRSDIHKEIKLAIASNDNDKLSKYIDAALSRLTKRYIRHWQKEDEFCLTHEERQRICICLAEIDNQKVAFEETVLIHCQNCLKEIDKNSSESLKDLVLRIPRIIEKLLLCEGELFVTAVLSNKLVKFNRDNLVDIILKDISDNPVKNSIIQHYPKIIAATIQNLFVKPEASTQLYLRRLSGSYTLFSFLNQTPDIQAATKKIFSYGTVWIDTTVLLPLIAEQLEEDEQARKLSNLIKICGETGIEFKVTTGIIQEINSHMNNALACSQRTSGTWQGRVPYLYSQYLMNGHPPASFKEWLFTFRGNERPDEDLASYLDSFFNIKPEDLIKDLEEIDDKLRWAIDRLWAEAHIHRRNSQQIDEATKRILIQHDIETYLGVISRRKQEKTSELGYKHWLLTIDKIAWNIRDQLKQEFKDKTPLSPLLSLSFLFKVMTFGPNRHLMANKENFSLPLILDLELSESMPYDLLEIADKTRHENAKYPEHVIRRMVRDAVDSARFRKKQIEYNSIFDECGDKQHD